MPQLDFAATLAMLMGARPIAPWDRWTRSCGHSRQGIPVQVVVEKLVAANDPGGDGGEDDFSAEDSDGLACESRALPLALEHNVVQVNEYGGPMARRRGAVFRAWEVSMGSTRSTRPVLPRMPRVINASWAVRVRACACTCAEPAYLTAVASLARARWTTFNVP